MPHFTILDRFRRGSRADDLRRLGLDAYFVPFEEVRATICVVGGQPKLNLGSNDYLGLSQHPKVQQGAIDALRCYGTSSSGSRLLSGTKELDVVIEAELVEFSAKRR